MFGTNPYHFQLFRQYNDEITQDGRWEDVLHKDLAIVDTVRLLNAHPGLATRWCCSGHTVEERKGLDPNESETASRGYVAMAYTREGFEYIYRVVHRFTHDLHPRYAKAIRIEFCMLASMWEDIDPDVKRRGWECLTLRFDRKHLKTEQMRERFYTLLNQCLREVTN